MKLDFNIVLERINDGRSVDRDQVKARDLKRKLWCAAWGIPGCLYENQTFSTTKEDAIDSALFMAEGEDGPPKGMLTALRQSGVFHCRSPLYGDVVNEVYQTTLGELVS